MLAYRIVEYRMSLYQSSIIRNISFRGTNGHTTSYRQPVKSFAQSDDDLGLLIYVNFVIP